MKRGVLRPLLHAKFRQRVAPALEINQMTCVKSQLMVGVTGIAMTETVMIHQSQVAQSSLIWRRTL